MMSRCWSIINVCLRGWSTLRCINVTRRRLTSHKTWIWMIVIAALTAIALIIRFIGGPSSAISSKWNINVDVLRVPWNFEGFDNVSGSQEPIVPDVVHYVKFRSLELDFVEMLSIRSVQLNHRPERIIIHCSMCVDVDGAGGLRGKYWDYLTRFSPRIDVRHLAEPTHVFGKRLSSVYHASDVARILVLMERGGGIYLDSDVFVVRSLRPFLHYEFAIGWPLGSESIGTQVLVANERARFLGLWLDSYRWYRPFMWYYNAGQLPAESILAFRPELIHRVPLKFGVHYLIDELYKTFEWPDWKEYYAVHLLSRHRFYLDEQSTVQQFDEENVKRYNFTFGEMARSVLYGTTNLIVP